MPISEPQGPQVPACFFEANIAPLFFYSLSRNSLAQKRPFSTHARASAKIRLTVMLLRLSVFLPPALRAGKKSNRFCFAKELRESP